MAQHPLILGIDPDSHNTAWAVATLHEVVAVGVIRGPEGGDSTAQITQLRHCSLALEVILKNFNVSMAVVEGQEYHYKSPAKPEHIFSLALVGGGIVGQIAHIAPNVKVCYPVPSEWKKQTPKAIHQARTYAHYGILATQGKDYSTPDGCAKVAKIDGYARIRRGDWKHVGDAIGLALYGSRLVAS